MRRKSRVSAGSRRARSRNAALALGVVLVSAWAVPSRLPAQAPPPGGEPPPSGAANTAAKPAPPAPAGSVEHGRKLFAAYHCYACHGFTGETGPAPRLNPPPLDEAAFIAYLRNPATSYRDGGFVSAVMPPYAADDVSDQDLADVYAYLASLPSTSPPAAAIDLGQ